MSLPEQWLEAKEIERMAIERRREIEDKLTSLFGVAETDEGTKNFEQDGYHVKLTMRHNRKVDADLVQEIAATIGVTNLLPKLYRWKPEINVAEMKKQSAEIQNALAGAVTVTPGRPSYSIEKKEI